MQKITIAIDGYSSCGKSTLAKALAQKLNYSYVDTGAMYRAVTLYALRNGIMDKEHNLDTKRLIKALDKIELNFEFDSHHKTSVTLLNGENVESLIRTMDVSENVSKVSAVKEVREKMIAIQRHLGKKKGVVMDGRDIGTVVFPNAELKLFVTADTDIRSKRRYNELRGKGEKVSLEEVKENLEKRDHIDTHRKESPLVQAEDAVIIDTSHLTRESQLDMVYELVMEKVEYLKSKIQ